MKQQNPIAHDSIMLPPSHPQQGSRGVQGTAARDSLSPRPGCPAGKPGESGCRRALTFPVKIIVWDANVNEALEDLQGEQRRAAGGDLHPAQGRARRSREDVPCAA